MAVRHALLLGLLAVSALLALLVDARASLHHRHSHHHQHHKNHKNLRHHHRAGDDDAPVVVWLNGKLPCKPDAPLVQALVSFEAKSNADTPSEFLANEAEHACAVWAAAFAEQCQKGGVPDAGTLPEDAETRVKMFKDDSSMSASALGDIYCTGGKLKLADPVNGKGDVVLPVPEVKPFLDLEIVPKPVSSKPVLLWMLANRICLFVQQPSGDLLTVRTWSKVSFPTTIEVEDHQSSTEKRLSVAKGRGADACQAWSSSYQARCNADGVRPESLDDSVQFQLVTFPRDLGPSSVFLDGSEEELHDQSEDVTMLDGEPEIETLSLDAADLSGGAPTEIQKANHAKTLAVVRCLGSEFKDAFARAELEQEFNDHNED